jgi:hypothetical protein
VPVEVGSGVSRVDGVEPNARDRLREPGRGEPADPRQAPARYLGDAEDHKIHHPDIGEITVDCDVLNDNDTDMKIVIYTAAPDSEDQARLDLARVAGRRARWA